MSAATITARLSRLPMTRSMWTLVLLLSLGGWFEIYDMFFTAYVGPGMVKSGLFSNTTASFFGFTGLGGFVAATFAGLFLGTFFLGLLSVASAAASSLPPRCCGTRSQPSSWRFSIQRWKSIFGG